jgi:predicted nucleotidyltransferase
MIKHDKLPTDILKRLHMLKPLFAQDQHVLFAFLFGGLARGAVQPLSDVDIAVYLKDCSNKAELKLELTGRLSEALGTDEIDLVILNDAPLSLVGRILKHRRLIVDKEPFLRHSFESRIMREFFDFTRKEQDILFRRFA